MSIDTMNSKIKELRELRRMADELAGEIEAIQDEIKAHMTESNTDTLTGIDWKVTWKAVTSKRLDTTALKKALPDVAERFMKESVSCQRRYEIVRKRRRNFVVFRRGVTKIRCCLVQKECSRFAVSGA